MIPSAKVKQVPLAKDVHSVGQMETILLGEKYMLWCPVAQEGNSQYELGIQL